MYLHSDLSPSLSLFLQLPDTLSLADFSQPEKLVTPSAPLHPAVQLSTYTDIYHSVNEMLHGFLARIPYLLISVAVFMLFWGATRLYKKMIRRALGSRATSNPNLPLVLGRIGSSTILFVGLMISLVIAIPNFTPSQLIGMLGIGSIAIGFAFKDIFQNLLSGILLLLSEPFKIGDHITTGNYTGTVETIDVRATVIRTDDGKKILVPNAQLYTGVVVVDTAYLERRLTLDLAIAYHDDLARAKQIVQQILQQHASVVQDSKPPLVHVTNLTPSYAIITAKWWIETSRTLTAADSADEIMTAVKTALEQGGISLPPEPLPLQPPPVR